MFCLKKLIFHRKTFTKMKTAETFIKSFMVIGGIPARVPRFF